MVFNKGLYREHDLAASSPSPPSYFDFNYFLLMFGSMHIIFDCQWLTLEIDDWNYFSLKGIGAHLVLKTMVKVVMFCRVEDTG